MAQGVRYKEERGPIESDLDYIEVYLPKRLAYLPEFYRYLREKIGKEKRSLFFHGYSVYEVDGAFLGKRNKIWEERSLVIRILFVRPIAIRDSQVRAKIRDLGRQVAMQVAPREEEIWICHHEHRVTRFFPKDYR